MVYILGKDGQSKWIITPTGSCTLTGSYSIETLAQEAANEIFSDSYRIAVIGVLGTLGKDAEFILPQLSQVTTNGKPSQSLIHAAQEAIKRIQESNSASSTMTTNPLDHYKHSNNYGTAYVFKTKINNISLQETTDTVVLRKSIVCYSCNKLEESNDNKIAFSKTLSGKLHCLFCLRNHYYGPKIKDIFCYSYKNLIAYCYYCHYYYPKHGGLLISEVTRLIDSHIGAGLRNPLFRYDYENYHWYVDVSRLKKGLTLNDIWLTIMEQLASLNLFELLGKGSPYKYFNQLKEALTNFIEKKERKGKGFVFCPKLSRCGLVGPKYLSEEFLLGFTPSNLQEKKKF